MDKSRISVSDLTEHYLNAHYYAPRFLENEKLLASCGIPRRPIGEIASKCNCGATPVDVVYEGEGQGLIRASDVRPNRFEVAKVLRTKALSVPRDGATAAVSNDLVFTMSGTIGFAAVVPESDEVFSYSNTIARVRFAQGSEYDPQFIAVFFNSTYGYTQSLRLTSGGIQGHVMPNPFKRLLVPIPSNRAQSYIGEKVRKAEQFRYLARTLSNYVMRTIDAFMRNSERARELECAVRNSSEWKPLCELLLDSGPARQLGARVQRFSRVSLDHLTSRLDCSFYAPDAIEVDERLADGYSTAALHEVVDPSRQITNGVRGPDLQSSSFKLVRLQDREGWSIDFEKCLSISESQFRENRRCELRERDVVVAIGGYIGHAVIVRRVQPAVIGQHSAVLPMGESSVIDEGFLVAYLSSRDGAVHLQRYVSGTVQAGINLEDLRDVRIPIPTREFQRHVGDAVRRADDFSFWSARLCIAASRLVESLVEGGITESDLVAAQRAIEAGDGELDREILSRLTVDGVDVPGRPPLFSDLDALYAAIEETQRSDPSNGDTV